MRHMHIACPNHGYLSWHIGIFSWESLKKCPNIELLQLYSKEGEKKLAQQAFDRARSIDPSLALPWAGMSADFYTR